MYADSEVNCLPDLPSNTAIEVYTYVDTDAQGCDHSDYLGSADWQHIPSNGGAIQNLEQGESLVGKYLFVIARLTSNANDKTPTLEGNVGGVSGQQIEVNINP